MQRVHTLYNDVNHCESCFLASFGVEGRCLKEKAVEKFTDTN